MKHFTKILMPKRGFANLWFALCAALTLLAWTGCSNIFSPMQQREQKGGLQITVASDANGSRASASRTLFSSASFTKYTLSFSGPTGASHADVTISSGYSTTITDLTDGAWTITAKGYVMLGGTEVEAASGSETVTISAANPNQSITIDMNLSMTGANGTLSYKIGYPSDKVDTAQLLIHPINNPASVTTRSLSPNVPDSVSLSPGYYIMCIQLTNANQTAGRADVVHIYSGMEATANYTFTNDDFADFITLSGTVDVTINDFPLHGVYLQIFIVDGTNENWIGSVPIDYDTGAWSWKTAVFAADTLLRFFYYGEEGVSLGCNDATVKDTDKVVDFTDHTTLTIVKEFGFTDNQPDSSFKADLDKSEYLPTSRIEAGDYYNFTYTFTSDTYIDKLVIYLVDNHGDVGYWNVLSNYGELFDIQPNTVFSGVVSLWAYKSATDASDIANKLRFDTDFGTTSAPTLQFTQFDFELEDQYRVVELNYNGDEDNYWGWNVHRPLGDFINSWDSSTDTIRTGDEYTLTYEFISSVNIDQGNLEAVLVDRTEDAEWYKSLSGYLDFAYGYDIEADHCYSGQIILIANDNASSIDPFANLFEITVSSDHSGDPSAQPFLFFFNLQLEKTANGDAEYVFTSNTGGNAFLPDSPYGYEMYTAGGNDNKLIWYGPDNRGGAAFRAEWNDPDDFLGRLGYYWGHGGSYTQYSDISVDFDYTRSGHNTAGNYSYIGPYGWSRNSSASADEKLIEYYIVEDWFGNEWSSDTNPMGTGTTGGYEKGSFEVDGSEYIIVTNLRENAPSIDGDTTFTQIFSIRQEPRQSGTISVIEHFNKWKELLPSFGADMYECKFLVEAGGGVGWLDLSYLEFRSEAADSLVVDNPPFASQWGASAAVDANGWVTWSGTSALIAWGFPTGWDNYSKITITYEIDNVNTGIGATACKLIIKTPKEGEMYTLNHDLDPDGTIVEAGGNNPYPNLNSSGGTIMLDLAAAGFDGCIGFQFNSGGYGYDIRITKVEFHD